MATITSAGSGDWDLGPTWTGGVVPGDADEAHIDSGHTVELTENERTDRNQDRDNFISTPEFTIADKVKEQALDPQTVKEEAKVEEPKAPTKPLNRIADTTLMNNASCQMLKPAFTFE